MKNTYLILFALFSNVALAQCPDGDVVLNSQNDVDAFVAAYPNCTEIDGDLIIDSQSEENPIQNLTGLGGLQTVSGTLRILDLDYFDTELDSLIPGSLQGLEGLTSVNEVWIGQGSDEPSYHIESLEPLNNITGFVERIRFNEVVFYEPLPEFPGITYLESFIWNTCTGAAETPAFPNVETIRWISVENDPDGLDSLRIVHIPNVESIEGPFGGTEEYGVRITSSPSLESVVGGEGLSAIEFLEITALSSLTDLSAFDEVTEIASEMIFAACQPEAFDSFNNLTTAGQMKIFVNYGPYACGGSLDEVQIRFGETAESLTTSRRSLELRVADVESLQFTANIEKLSGLGVDSRDTGSIIGLAALDSIVASEVNASSLTLSLKGSSGLPDLISLRYISNSLGIYLSEGASLDDLSVFEALEHVYNEIHISGDDTGSLTNLNGLQGLSFTQDIFLGGITDLTDISAIFGIEYLEGLHLYSLPAFEQILDLQEPDGFNQLHLYDLPMTDLSQLQNFESLPRLEIIENASLLTTAGMENITTMFSLDLIDNPLLSEIDLPFGLGIDRVNWTGNPSLSACPGSPLICDILLNADPDWRELGSNGSGCNDVDEILAACTLNDDIKPAPFFRVGMDGNGDVILHSNLSGEALLSVYDLTGRLVSIKRISLFNDRQRIDLSEISQGAYLFELRQGSARFTQKVVLSQLR